MSKVKWGVLGTAGIAKNQTIPGMKEAANCELYAIAGRNMEKAAVFQKDFGFEKIFHEKRNIVNREIRIGGVDKEDIIIFQKKR